GLQRVVPGQDVLVDAVHQRAVEVEQESGLWRFWHGGAAPGGRGGAAMVAWPVRSPSLQASKPPASFRHLTRIRAPSRWRVPLRRRVGGIMAKANREPIKHVVVLMMENRSFDHLLGACPKLAKNNPLNGVNSYNGADF